MTEQPPGPLAGPPYVTGGGIVLEHRYGAILLAALLTATRSRRSVDDLLAVGRTLDGGERRMSVGSRGHPALPPATRPRSR